MSGVSRLRDAYFEREVLESDVPVLVEFWASWCPPCKMMDPTLAQLAAEYAGRLKVCKINADQNPRTVLRYTIQGLPTFIVFDAGEVKGRRTGAQSRGQLQTLLEEARVQTLSEDARPAVSGLEAGEYQAEDEERILKGLRALGYVD
jgi:thioredoxin 1